MASDKKKLQAPRGMRDVLPVDSHVIKKIRDACSKVARTFDYHEISTPLVEDVGVFSRTVGEESDLMQKEMYVFEDRGGELLALRPENTAGVGRAYIEHGMKSQAQPVRLWYFGSFFRYDRPQAGRYRQLTQFGIEAIGSKSPSLDAEAINLQSNLYESLGLTNLRLSINSIGTGDARGRFIEAFRGYLRRYSEELSTESQSRLITNPLRILDSKSETDRAIVAGGPKILDYLDDDETKHFSLVLRDLDSLGIQYEIDSSIVRGLDYYTHTVWEFEPEIGGGQSTIGAGGRYDGLLEQLGGDTTPGVGFATGIERIILNMGEQGLLSESAPKPDVFMIPVNEPGHEMLVGIANNLRKSGVSVRSGELGRSVKALMRAANSSDATIAILAGDSEVEERKVTVKHLQDSDRAIVDSKVELSELAPLIQKILVSNKPS